MNLNRNFLFLKFNYFKILFYFLPFVSFFFSLYQLNQQYDGHHHGVVFSISEDFLSGKIPYKEFLPHYGIVFVIINSLFIKVFSTSIYGTYVLIALCKGISILLFGMIIKKISDDKNAISAMFMLFFLQPFVDTPWPEYLFFFTNFNFFLYFIDFTKKVFIFFFRFFIFNSWINKRQFNYFTFLFSDCFLSFIFFFNKD